MSTNKFVLLFFKNVHNSCRITVWAGQLHFLQYCIVICLLVPQKFTCTKASQSCTVLLSSHCFLLLHFLSSWLSPILLQQIRRDTDIHACCTHKPTCAESVLDTCQLWLSLIRYSCFLIIPVVQRRSDLNKSATGTGVPPLHLLMAIVSPWEVFQSMAVVFSRRGKCVDGFHSDSEVGGAVWADACKMC